MILKTDLLLHPREYSKIRNDVIQQIECGAVIIPNGFAYAICKHDCLEHPEVVARKRMIDVDIWIDKLTNAMKQAPADQFDYCLHLINEIETEFLSQEVQAMQEGE